MKSDNNEKDPDMKEILNRANPGQQVWTTEMWQTNFSKNFLL